MYNTQDVTDEGAVRINYYGAEGGGTKFRDFAVYDGKLSLTPIFKVVGKTSTAQVNGLFSVSSPGRGVDICNTAYTKDDPKLQNMLSWRDSAGSLIAAVGFDTTDSFRFAVRNALGDIVLATLGSVDVIGTLKVNGKSVADTYVTVTTYTSGMNGKVDKVDGKQLSTEDFTTEYKRKLDAISTGGIAEGGTGYVTSGAVAEALKTKLSADQNLQDVKDKGAARTSLDVYSKSESKGVFLQISEGLQELVRLTADEINGMTPEEASALKAERQAAVRATIDAEKGGTGELKLSKTSNLSDLPDKTKARKNLEVYSKTEVDGMMAGKLGTDSAYQGIIFTPEFRDKLINIETGSFAYVDADGKSHTQVEGYVMTSAVVKELKKKANWLLDGYNATELATIAKNLEFYAKSVADGRFARMENLFQDYINYLVAQGKSSAQAQAILREKLNLLSKDDPLLSLDVLFPIAHLFASFLLISSKLLSKYRLFLFL